MTAYPSTTVAGVSHNFTVTAIDAFGNTAPTYVGTVAFTSSDSQASFTPTSYTFVPGDNGVHSTFSAFLGTVGNQSITATDAGNGFINTENSIAVTPSAATHFIVSGYPTHDVGGQIHPFTVTAEDAFNNIATGYTGTINLTSTDSNPAFVPSTYPFNAADAGTHVFNGTLNTVGSQTIFAKDSVNPNTINGNESGIVVTAASSIASRLTVSGFPLATTAGVAQFFVVSATDQFGNLAAGYTGTVTLTSTDPQVIFTPSTYTFTAADNSSHIFVGTFKTAGTQTITAIDIAHGFNGTEPNIVVTAATASQLVVSGYPATVAGVAKSFTVTAEDPFGNIAPSYTGTVKLTSSDLQASLRADPYTFAAGDNGVHTFSGTLETSGTQSITATDTANNLVNTQTGIVVTAASCREPHRRRVPDDDDSRRGAQLHGHDQGRIRQHRHGFRGYGHRDQQRWPRRLHGRGFLRVHDRARQRQRRPHVCAATLDTAGLQSITATDPAQSSLTNSESGITVVAAAATKLLVSGFPTATTAGITAAFTVTAEDPFNNVATGYVGAIQLTSTDGQAVLSPSVYTFTTGLGNDNGVHTFSGTLKTSGIQSITATDIANSLTNSETNIAVTAATATKLFVTGFPSPITAGIQGNFTITARDAFGNIATGFHDLVNLISSDSQVVFVPLAASYTFTTGGPATTTASTRSRPYSRRQARSPSRSRIR